jgi:hypothetical protein
MGQQQLLLLVLGIMVVAIAIVVGIFAFQTNLKKANADALVSDAVRIANLAQAWKLKPAALGGQPTDNKISPEDFRGFSLEALALQDPYITLNGTFTVDEADANLQMGLVIVGENPEFGNTVTVTVDGVHDNDIIVAIATTEVQAPE